MLDVLIIGAGPAGLSAALALGRARKRVLLCDSGPRRNAAAVHVQNFITRDGTPPDQLRALGRKDLATYPSVEVRDVRVESITGSRGAFKVQLSDGAIEARRVLLATGLIDELPPLEGFREHWGTSIVQCPYCHGYELRDRRWGYFPRAHDAGHAVPFALQLRGWTAEVTLFTGGAFELPAESRAMLDAAGIVLETRPVTRLVGQGGALQFVEVADGARVPCDVLFAHPPQRQVKLVQSLTLALDADGFVQVDPMRRETSVPGIYAAGDLITRLQAAIVAAGAGTIAAAAINGDLSMELR
jgi:thioredoxin reductase